MNEIQHKKFLKNWSWWKSIKRGKGLPGEILSVGDGHGGAELQGGNGRRRWRGWRQWGRRKNDRDLGRLGKAFGTRAARSDRRRRWTPSKVVGGLGLLQKGEGSVCAVHERIFSFLLDFPDGIFPAQGKSDIEGIFPPPYFEWFQFDK
ncbi:hypothetical protein TIFTF001_045664, partial [Ficus carica]